MGHVLRGSELREKIRTVRGWGAKRLLGQDLHPKQLEIERAIFEGPRKATAVSGCVGSGKTLALASAALLWLLSFKPSRVLSMAPSFRQVETNLWGYMKQLWNQAAANGTPLGDRGDMKQIPRIDFSCGPDCQIQHAHVADWYYKGFTTDDPGNVHGIHGVNDLLIFDDAQGMTPALAEELENMRAGGNVRFVLAYNKTVLHGPTYDATHVEARDYNNVGINFADLEAARRSGFKLDGALGKETVDRWFRKYGKASNFCRVKVFDLHPKQEKDTLIPLDWIEQAYDREVQDTGPLVLGCDVAMEGSDASAMAPGRGRMCFEIQEWHEDDAMVTAGKFVATMKEEESHVDGRAQTSRAYAFVDGIGMGGPVVNRIAEQTNRIKGHREGCRGCDENLKVEAIIGSEDAEGRVLDGGVMKDACDVFKNKRSQVYWNLRECLDPNNADLIGLTKDADLQAQLSVIRWRVGSDGRKEVEPKRGTQLVGGGKESSWGIKNRLNLCVDKADALAYLAWGMCRFAHGEAKVAGPTAKADVSGDRFATAQAHGHDDVFTAGVSENELDGVN